MTRRYGLTVLAIAALLVAATAGALAAALGARVTAGAPAGPVCVGLIVTGCYARMDSAAGPARTSPLAFLVVLIIGAVAVTWLSNQADRVDEEPPEGARRLDEEEDSAMRQRTITWADLAPRPANTYELAGCPHCGHTLARRLPEQSFHRHLADARAGQNILAVCPKCGAPLRTGNRPN